VDLGTSPDDGQTATVSFAQMLKAGAKSTVWPKAKTDSEKSPKSSTTRHVGSDESDNEDKVPVPEFHSSFGSALETAFESIHTRKGRLIRKVQLSCYFGIFFIVKTKAVFKFRMRVITI